MPLVTDYPIIALSPSSSTETGIISGEDDSGTTTKKIWTAAQERQIEDTVSNRELAYDIDPLVRHISNIKRFSILAYYDITSDDDAEYDPLITNIKTYLEEIKILQTFRESFTWLQVHGVAHIQAWEGDKKKGLSVLRNVQKFTDPSNITEYYFYQKLYVSANWKDPEERGIEEKKVWFIDLDNQSQFTTINKVQDDVFSRDVIIEIRSNEVGESNLQPILSLIFIKNYLMQLLPNLITIVTSPDEEIIYTTRDKAGNLIVPKKPPQSLQETDLARYNELNSIYDAWKSRLQALSNRLTRDRTKLGRTIHSDEITEKILESAQSVNSEMINTLISVLDTQIAYGMGFSRSLLDAQGVELSTARNIYSSVAVTMRGIQEQYERIAYNIIYDQFPEAEKAGIKFSLGELNPEDERITAETKKIHAEIVDLLYNLGFSTEGLENYVGQKIDDSLTISSMPEETTEAAAEAIRAMVDYRKLANEGGEE